MSVGLEDRIFMALKAFLALAAIVAVALGLALPTPGRAPETHTQSQIPTLELGPA
jgi:hypothetical protein